MSPKITAVYDLSSEQHNTSHDNIDSIMEEAELFIKSIDMPFNNALSVKIHINTDYGYMSSISIDQGSGCDNGYVNTTIKEPSNVFRAKYKYNETIDEVRSYISKVVSSTRQIF